MRCDEYGSQLDALYDQELPEAEAVELRAHLAQCPSCSARFDTLARTSNRLKEGAVRYHAPDVLKARIRGALSQADLEQSSPIGGRPRWWRLAVAGLVIAAASSAATMVVMGRGDGSRSTADQVLAGHLRALMPNHLVDVASTDQHNVKPWFNGRIDVSPQVPALDSAGFPLVGGRLDYLVGRAVAAVVYSRRQHLISVYSWPESGTDLSEAMASARGYHLVHWRAAGLVYWAVSDLNSAELSQFVAMFERHESR